MQHQSAIFLLLCVLGQGSGLTVDCALESSSKMSCRCFGFDRDSEGVEDLGGLVSRFLLDQFSNLFINHVEVRECGTLAIRLNLRQVLDGVNQRAESTPF